MEEYRWLRAAQHSCEADLASRRGEEILATNDEIDTLTTIIDGHRKLVRPVPVTVAQQQISGILRRYLRDPAPQAIVERFSALTDFYAHAAARHLGERA
jgi:hypothetical protein